LIETYKDQIENQASKIYDNTIIRKLPTYLKKIAQVYPAYKNEILEQMIKNFPHKERPQIVGLLVYQKFAQKLAAMLNTNLCPQAEARIFKLIIDNIANLDVDIKIRLRKGTHLVKMPHNNNLSDKKVIMNNILKKIETKE